MRDRKRQNNEKSVFVRVCFRIGHVYLYILSKLRPTNIYNQCVLSKFGKQGWLLILTVTLKTKYYYDIGTHINLGSIHTHRNGYDYSAVECWFQLKEKCFVPLKITHKTCNYTINLIFNFR